jgi:hypothetical protein
MPLHWTFSPPKRLVLAFCKGQVKPEEAMAFLAKVDEENARSFAKIFDVTDLESSFSDEQIVRFGELVRLRNAEQKVGPIAIVTRDERTHRQAELFIGLAPTSQPIRLFREHHDARAWIESLSS